MGTSPYVRRGKKWDSTLRQNVWGNTIVIGERHYDGVETDYTDKFNLSPDEARYVATELWKLAEEIDGKTQKTSTLAKIRKNTDKIAKAAKAEACG